MHTVAIVVARMDSTRLPGKVLRDACGRPVIDYVLTRTSRIKGINQVVVATTTRSVDDPLVAYLLARNTLCFRGAADDVAKRLLDCAREYEADHFIRVNADSPFVDYELIDEALKVCFERELDFVTNLIGRTFPYGIAVEIIRTQMFEQIYPHITHASEREHPTKYLYNHLALFRTWSMTSPHPDLASIRLVIDTPEDFVMFQRLVTALGHDVDTATYDRVARIRLAIERSSS